MNRNPVIEHEREQLVKDEGVRLRPYYCSANRLTIGVGRNLEDNPLTFDEKAALMATRDHLGSADDLIADFWVNGITMEEAHMLLENDMQRFYAELVRRLNWYSGGPLEVQAILLNMAFNMGIGSLLGFNSTLPLIAAGRYAEAGERLKKSKWAQQVPNRANRLITRLIKIPQQ